MTNFAVGTIVNFQEGFIRGVGRILDGPINSLYPGYYRIQHISGNTPEYFWYDTDHQLLREHGYNITGTLCRWIPPQYLTRRVTEKGNISPCPL